MQVASMKLASTVSIGLRVQQTAARFQYKTNCVKLESALKTNFPTVRQHPPQDLSSRGSRAYSTDGIIEPDLPISGVSAGESSISKCDPADAALTLVYGLIARGLLDAIWDKKEPIIQVSYNDKNSTYIPKKVITKYKTKAELESFMKKAFDVPANKSVKLAFKPTGEQRKQRFLEDYVAEQLSIAVAVYFDDV